MVFCLHRAHYPRTDLTDCAPYLAGSFNQWETARKDPRWRLEPVGDLQWKLRLRAGDIHGEGPHAFKFITEDGQWLEPPATAPNRTSPWKGVANLRFDPKAQGTWLLHFELPEGFDPYGTAKLLWKEPEHRETYALPRPTTISSKQSAQRLGTQTDAGRTTFRLFAPRAESVSVTFCPPDNPGAQTTINLEADADGTWSAQHPANLEGHHYTYRVGGKNLDASTEFDVSESLTDPYATALASASGPGIVDSRKPTTATQFVPPPPEDLQIVEVHLRDALSEAPLELDGPQRRGFTGLAKWLRTGETYFHRLGINAVELLPVHEYDCDSPHEYHWGYMPVNLCSPSSSYAQSPAAGSQIAEFQDLVRAFHEEKFAVILDVVLNHQGIYTPLHGIDKGYYFEMDDSLELLNWSGCGNDIRADAPMVRRLLVDSLVHWVRTYDVDGFRLDLAELIGLETLTAIETALRKEKPGIILIAEPWSFRGHIAKALRTTSYSSWNDGFREFVCSYVQGEGTSEELAYFLGGSPKHFATFPAQTVNYIDSHDDRCWIDKITENAKHDGRQPSPLDIRRTHLATGILHMALGIPMLAGGFDFLRSKHGIHNTYQRGDLNILDYAREEAFPDTVRYVRNWVRFRSSPQASRLRRRTFPDPDALHFHHGPDGNSLALHHHEGGRHLLFAINPTGAEVQIHLPAPLPGFQLLADESSFYNKKEPAHMEEDDAASGQLRLPAQSLRLWSSCEG